MGNRPLVVVLSGAPGSGKTTLARALGDALHLPVVSRDLVKTGMHVTHRADDPADVHRYADDAWDAFWATLDELVDRGVSIVAEAAFHARFAAAPLAALGVRADVVHVAVHVPPPVAAERYAARHAAGLRHPGHGDAGFAAAMTQPDFDWDRYVVTDPAPALVVTATDGFDPWLPSILATIERARTS